MSNKSIFTKIKELSHEALDSYIDNFKKSNPQVRTLPFGMQYNVYRKSWEEDLERLQAEYGYIYKLTMLTDHHKLLMYLKNPIIAAIVQTRKTQLSTFTRPQSDKYSEGFSFTKKEKSPLTVDEQETIQKLNNWVVNCGISDEARTNANEDSKFGEWMKRSIQDSLIYDAVATEIIYDNQGRLHHWLPVSSSTIRLSAPSLSDGHINNSITNFKIDKEQNYKYVQVVNNQVRNAFTDKEMLYEFRNPTNDMFTNGYPISELDLLMNVVAAHLNADTYNRSIFTQGMTAPGIINLKGENIDDEQLAALRRSYYAQGIGVDSMFKTPIINAPDGIEFLKLDISHREMEYANYVNYLIKLMCAIYQMAPEELGFQSSSRSEGAAGNSQNYNNVEKRLKLSLDRGLRPLLRFFEDIINEKLLPKFSPDLASKYVFTFVGLNSEDRKEELARMKDEIATYKTVNEIRAEKDLPALPGCEHLILNPVYFQWYSQMSPDGEEFQEKQAQQQQAQAPQGAQGAEGQDQSGLQYVDEQGNPIDPSKVDPNSMEFTDEQGNPVNPDGSPKTEEGQLPFEQKEETPPEENQAEPNKLPFEKE